MAMPNEPKSPRGWNAVQPIKVSVQENTSEILWYDVEQTRVWYLTLLK